MLFKVWNAVDGLGGRRLGGGRLYVRVRVTNAGNDDDSRWTGLVAAVFAAGALAH